MTTSEIRRAGSVAIVGAGPAGLTLARLLQMRGVSVSVYERDASASARPQGGSLDLRPSLAQRAIKAARLWQVFERASRSEAADFKLLDASGKPIPDGGGETHEDAGPEIDRGELRQLLVDSLQPGTIIWNSLVTNADRDASGRWRLEFENHPSVTADLIVGADGIGSKVRERLTSVRPSYTGHTMLAANIRRDLWRNSAVSDLLGEGSMMIAGDKRTIFVQRCARNVILLYFSMIVAEDWPARESFDISDTAAVLTAVRQAYHDISPDLLAMLTELDGGFQRWPLSIMPPDYGWETQPGLTMLGDAAHVMPPFTGKGVNLALLDALELADALTADSPTDLASAIGAFEAGMQARTREEIGACLAVGRSYYGINMEFGA
ncbi:FAD-dependent oxidoreductase [Lichenicoccus sp.]|uniref:FAD-dependent oxidoreductase n=1 Tax=Lichenicoccus sp. TaxID=2781899 RepID=UPI003D112134